VTATHDRSTGDGPEYDVDLRERPSAYETGRGEQGVFNCEPYKSELLPLWSVTSLAEAEAGAEAIHRQFREYRDADEFPGVDLARKYLQMGWTRAMRYAKYPGGQKYEDGEGRDPQQWYDEEKREIALVYKDHLDTVREDETYRRRREAWRE
jgi:hypothetical protein